MPLGGMDRRRRRAYCACTSIGGMNMPYLSGKALWPFVVATLSGACLHFLYVLFPNLLTALIAPVNESLWEHVKILFWPGAVATLYLYKKEPDAHWAPRLLCLVVACAAMLGIGYVYHVVLGGDALSFDLCLYVLLMAAVVLLPAHCKLHLPDRVVRLALPLTVVLAAAILLFTFLPPDCILFYDLSGAPSWARLPC